MCGIAAILTPNPIQRNEFLDNAIHLLHHRGPDGQGIWQDDHIGLAHTRLAILDLSEAGAQPMVSESGRYMITYNGEIYNHLELRQKYFPGRGWRGHSDTETLLALFEKLGTALFAELVGMWSMAIWDNHARRLLISRDRFGQKPLYYRFYLDGCFALASEIKPLLIPGQSNPANPLMVAEYLALGNYGHLGAQTFFAEVQQLLPGHFAWITPGQHTLVPEAYWRLPRIPRRDKIPVGEREIAQLRELLLDAVRSQTLSDVPIGATLSGGLDSSLVTGILAAERDNANALDIFTAQTPGSRWDESPYVRAVQEKWGARLSLHAKDLNQVRISEFLEQSLLIQEEPYGDPSIMAHGFLMDMAKEAGIKVVLGGQGADEVFRGYPHNIHQLFSHELRWGNWPYALRAMRQANLNSTDSARILLGAFLPKLERELRRQSRKKKRFFLSPALQEAAQAAEHQQMLALANDWEDGMRESIQGVHIPHLVSYDDRNGMARSIEGRMPFLDHRLLEYTAVFHPAAFYCNGFSKALLREAGRKHLPDVVMGRRDKIGFYTPLTAMLLQDIDWIREVLSHAYWNSLQIRDSDIRVGEVSVFSGDIALRMWRTISMEIWRRQFNILI